MGVKEQSEDEKKKEYLNRYLHAKSGAEQIARKIEELKLAKMNPSSYRIDGMPRGAGRGGDLSEYAERLDELETRLLHQLNEKLCIYEEIIDRLDSMKDETESIVLRMRYIHGMKMSQIAGKLDYEERQVYRIYKKALKNFQI